MAQLTASNTYNATYSPHQARFNKPANLPQNCGCWRPKTEPYLFTVMLDSYSLTNCEGVGGVAWWYNGNTFMSHPSVLTFES